MVAVATTQEEISWGTGGGALICASCVNPQMAIVVDVTFATDYPGMEKKELGEANLGGGPALNRGSIISPVVFKHSPNEMVSLADLDTSAELIAETCRMVTTETDFTAR